MKLRPDILRTLLGFCNAYEKQMSEALCEFWNNVLEDLTPEELAKATKDYAKGPNSAWFPKPGQLYQLARPPVDLEPEAVLIVEEILGLIGTCGANDSERAMGKLSEKGRQYIEQIGGWYKFASDMQRTDISEMGIYKANMRKAIIGICNRKTNPSLQIEGGMSLKSLGITMKSIGEVKDEQ